MVFLSSVNTDDSRELLFLVGMAMPCAYAVLNLKRVEDFASTCGPVPLRSVVQASAIGRTLTIPLSQRAPSTTDKGKSKPTMQGK
eukprot:95399-Amphidinium_carterae.1